MGIFCYRLLKIFLLLLPIANSIPQIHTYTAIILFTQKNFNTGTYLFINFNTISQAPYRTHCSMSNKNRSLLDGLIESIEKREKKNL